ncbi:MAG: linked oxidase domain protein [Tardiphaga sp.]|nr:linked oxidase domain protein [Tardiphaga sp.]
MTDLIGRILHQLGQQLPSRVSRSGDDGYTAATAIWARPVGPMPRAVVHCLNSQDVQAAIRAARDSELPLSVRGGGHDWAGRALCGGIVIDLRAMNGVTVGADRRSAQISGGARACDVLAATDPLGLAAVTGSCGGVGMAGFTLGGGYGALIGRCGLALDNLLSAEIVLADGRIVTAKDDSETELFWASRGGGGNFGVVTSMQHRVHDISSVRAGMLLFPFVEAEAVFEACAEIAAAAPDELTVQLGIAIGPDGHPVIMVVPTWCGLPDQGEAQVAPFFKLGTLIGGAVDAMLYGSRHNLFAPFIVDGHRVVMETCWLPALERESIGAFTQAMATAVSPGCAIVTHAFRGAASRVPADATAFGLRRDHVLIEILASCPAGSNPAEQQRHRQWAHTALQGFAAKALPGGYPNLLPGGDSRAARSYGGNAERLIKAKRHYDPDGIFSAIPLPIMPRPMAAE